MKVVYWAAIAAFLLLIAFIATLIMGKRNSRKYLRGFSLTAFIVSVAVFTVALGLNPDFQRSVMDTNDNALKATKNSSYF